MHTNGMENKSQKKETQNGEAWHFFPINHRHNDLTAIFQIGSANKRMLEEKKKKKIAKTKKEREMRFWSYINEISSILSFNFVFFLSFQDKMKGN